MPTGFRARHLGSRRIRLALAPAPVHRQTVPHSCVFTLSRKRREPHGSQRCPRIVARSSARTNTGIYGSGRSAGRARARRRRSQLKLARGGRSVPARTADASVVAGKLASWSRAGFAGVFAPMTVGIIVPGQTAARSAAHSSAQQSMPSWLLVMCDEPAIGSPVKARQMPVPRPSPGKTQARQWRTGAASPLGKRCAGRRQRTSPSRSRGRR